MIRTYLKYAQPWQQLLIFVGLTLAISLVGSLLIGLLIEPITGVSMFNLSDVLSGQIKAAMQHRPALIFAQAANVLVMFIIPAYLFAYFADPEPSAFLQTDKLPKPYFTVVTILLVFLGLIATSALGILNAKVQFANSAINNEKSYELLSNVMLKVDTNIDLIVNVLVVGLLAAISEELFFRGVLQRIMIHWAKSPWIGIMITALLFSFFHFQLSGFLPRFGLGILLGALYWYSGSLYIPIIYHFLHNTIGVLATHFSKDLSTNKTSALEEKNAVGILIFGAICLVGIIIIMKEMSKKNESNYAELYPPKPSFFDEQT